MKALFSNKNSHAGIGYPLTSKEDKKTKRIAIIGLAIVLLLLPALALNCGGKGEENKYIVSPKDAVKWTEEIPFTCTYSQERPAEQAYMEGLDPNAGVDEYIEEYYAQEVDCFDVFVTDGKGNEYICYKDGAECE